VRPQPEGVADNKQDVPQGVSVQEELYAAVSAASSWLDSAENNILSGPVLLSEDTETQLSNLEVTTGRGNQIHYSSSNQPANRLYGAIFPTHII
jgi:hypothetical protein